MRVRWLSRRALLLHATLAVAFPGFLALGWWQLHRALGGNELSWAYTVEWPLFSGYAVFMWWKLLHERTDTSPSATAGQPTPEAVAAAMRDAARPCTARPGATTPGAPALLGPAPSEAVPLEAAEHEDEDLDEALEAYNSYLTRLNAQGSRKSWRWS